jgi:hypothetical protein
MSILGQEGWPTVTEHERLNYLNDHIGYEVIMLNYTLMRLMTFKASTAKDELDRNAFLSRDLGLDRLAMLLLLLDPPWQKHEVTQPAA